jgi:hypothetical protein
MKPGVICVKPCTAIVGFYSLEMGDIEEYPSSFLLNPNLQKRGETSNIGTGTGG